MSESGVVKFSREDERKLTTFKERLATGASLTAEENEQMEYLLLKYQQFLDEGERRLQMASTEKGNFKENKAALMSARSGTSPLQEQTTSEYIAESLGVASRAAYFWGSLVATAVPGIIGKHTGISPSFSHWNWITDRLILGALPVMTQVMGSGNHMSQIRNQLQERNQRLRLVVACLDKEEMNGYGVGLIEFAQERHWHEHISPAIEYKYLPMLDGTAEISMEEVISAVDMLYKVLDVEKCAAYVHCKAGKGRSWMVCMCYLITYGGRSYENASALIRMSRQQVNPSKSQMDFPKDFKKKFEADREARKMIEDEHVDVS